MIYDVHILYDDINDKAEIEAINYVMHFDEDQGLSTNDIRNVVISIGNGGFLKPIEENEKNMEFISSDRITKIWYEEIESNIVKPSNIVNVANLKRE